jgi:Ca2+-binding EF-hand superfamily protein
MRRILRKIAANEVDQLGDVSTLADPSVVEQLVRGLTELQREELREAFNYIDSNRDGRLDVTEFAKLLASLKTGATEQQAQSGFAVIDTDHDGSITFDEFVSWYVAS